MHTNLILHLIDPPSINTFSLRTPAAPPTGADVDGDDEGDGDDDDDGGD